MAHELSHARFNDPNPRTRRTRTELAIFYLAAIVLVIGGVVAGGVAAIALGATGDTVVGGSVAGMVAGAVIMGIGLTGHFKRSDRRQGVDHRIGKDRWLKEVRADLGAAHMVGRRVAYAGLEEYLPAQQPWWRRPVAIPESVLVSLLGDPHPPTPLRLNMILDYQPGEDPDLAARRLLHEHGLDGPVRRSPIWLWKASRTGKARTTS